MADTKISALTALTAASSDDLIPIVDDPSGTPVTKKITFGNFKNSLGGATSLATRATKTNSIKATGSFNANGGNGNIGDTCAIGSETWTFVATRTVAFEVSLGVDSKSSMQNLTSAINADSTTTDASWDGNNVCALQAKVAGTVGNRTLTVVSSKFAASGATMTGGVNGSGAGSVDGEICFDSSFIYIWDNTGSVWKKSTLATA